MPPAALDEPYFIEQRAQRDAAVAGQRAHVRVHVALEIAFTSVHNFFSGFVENLSAGGIFIATYKLLAVGETLAFEVRVPGSDTPVTGVGEVRWVRDPNPDSDVQPGMGIRFLTLGEGSNEAIAAYIAQREPMFYDE